MSDATISINYCVSVSKSGLAQDAYDVHGELGGYKTCAGAKSALTRMLNKTYGRQNWLPVRIICFVDRPGDGRSTAFQYR